MTKRIDLPVLIRQHSEVLRPIGRASQLLLGLTTLILCGMAYMGTAITPDAFGKATLCVLFSMILFCQQRVFERIMKLKSGFMRVFIALFCAMVWLHSAMSLLAMMFAWPVAGAIVPALFCLFVWQWAGKLTADGRRTLRALSKKAPLELEIQRQVI